MGSFDWDALVEEAAQPEAQMTEGMYVCVVDEAEFKDSSNGDPQFKIVYEVEGGPHQGRKLWSWLTAASSSDYSRRLFVQDLRTLMGTDDIRFDLNNPDWSKRIGTVRCWWPPH